MRLGCVRSVCTIHWSSYVHIYTSISSLITINILIVFCNRSKFPSEYAQASLAQAGLLIIFLRCLSLAWELNVIAARTTCGFNWPTITYVWRTLSVFPFIHHLVLISFLSKWSHNINRGEVCRLRHRGWLWSFKRCAGWSPESSCWSKLKQVLMVLNWALK